MEFLSIEKCKSSLEREIYVYIPVPLYEDILEKSREMHPLVDRDDEESLKLFFLFSLTSYYPYQRFVSYMARYYDPFSSYSRKWKEYEKKYGRFQNKFYKFSLFARNFWFIEDGVKDIIKEGCVRGFEIVEDGFFMYLVLEFMDNKYNLKERYM